MKRILLGVMLGLLPSTLLAADKLPIHPLVVMIVMDGCPVCARMERETWPQLQAMKVQPIGGGAAYSERADFTLLNVDHDPDGIAGKLSIGKSYPQFAVFGSDAHGKVIRNSTGGFHSATALIPFLEAGFIGGTVEGGIKDDK